MRTTKTSTLSILAVALTFASLACGGSDKPAETPSTNASSTSNDTAATDPKTGTSPGGADAKPTDTAADAKPTDVKPADDTAKALDKPASTHKIGTASLSDVDEASVTTALEKAAAGFKVKSAPKTVDGKWETLSFQLMKGDKPAGVVGLVRPAKQPAASVQPDSEVSAKAQVERQKKAGVGETFYDETAEVAIFVATTMGKKTPKDKEVLDKLVTKSK